MAKVEAAPVRAGYLDLLAQNPDYGKLYVGQIVSLLGDWFNYIAVQFLVYDLTGSALATGLAIIASNLPAFLLIPVAGVIVDRFDRRKIMILSDLARFGLALGFLLVRSADQLWLVYCLTAALVTFGSFFNPAMSSAIPNLVRREQLLTANALSNATWGFMLAAGAMVGGLTIAAVGSDTAFVLNSLSFLFSAAMLLLIRAPFSSSPGPTHHRLNPWAEFRQGLAYAWDRPQLLALMLVKTGGALAGGLVLLLTVFAMQVYQIGALGIGLFQAARGAGILVGPLVVRSLVGSDIGRMHVAMAAGFFLTGTAYLLFGLAPAAVVALFAILAAHMGWGSNWALSSTLIQELTPDYVRGRVFSMDIGLFTLALALSTFVTGAAVEVMDPRSVAAALAAIFLLFGAIWSAGVWWGRRHTKGWREGDLYQ